MAASSLHRQRGILFQDILENSISAFERRNKIQIQSIKQPSTTPAVYTIP